MADKAVAEFKLADIKAHHTRNDIWFVINGNAYDVTKFLDEHPGGEEVLLEQAGQDATEAFEDVGHSSEARTMLKSFFKGKVTDSKSSGASKSGKAAASDLRPTPPSTSASSSVLLYFVPVVVILAIAYSYWSRSSTN